MLRIVMAQSADGFVCLHSADDMKWTGSDDKAAFRLLTSVGGVVLAGSRTVRHMPTHLPGRNLFEVSRRKGLTLEYYASHLNLKDAWLVGGQTVALAAIEQGLVSEVHLCTSPVRIDHGERCMLVPAMMKFPRWGHKPAMATDVGLCRVECWRKMP